MMNKNGLNVILLKIVLALLVWPAVLMLTGEAKAAPTVVPVKDAAFNVNAGMVDNLKMYVGKKITITLDSGNVFTGLVKEVGNHLVHLEKLEGKEYFDALILIEQITAIESRFREMVR
ncbi:MAG: hypothetical protein KJ950_11070 [Proteobacteria bacterium]|nr:hypothetical protein [Pseudomonadota bacterium]MBU1687700.1 hypothetical protein [Pseudomonadota bacterium]